MHQNRTKTVGACTHFIIWRKQKQSPKFSRKREREREIRPATWSLYATSRSRVALKIRPKASPGSWSAGSASSDVNPRQQTFLSCSLQQEITLYFINIFFVSDQEKKKLHDTQALLWLKSRIIKSLEDERINNLLKFARTPLFLTCCNIWNQRPKISVATPNLCNMLRVKAAL